MDICSVIANVHREFRSSEAAARDVRVARDQKAATARECERALSKFDEIENAALAKLRPRGYSFPRDRIDKFKRQTTDLSSEGANGKYEVVRLLKSLEIYTSLMTLGDFDLSVASEMTGRTVVRLVQNYREFIEWSMSHDDDAYTHLRELYLDDWRDRTPSNMEPPRT